MFDLMIKKLDNGRFLIRNPKTSESSNLTPSQAMKYLEEYLVTELEDEAANEEKMEQIRSEAQKRLSGASKQK